MAQHAADYAGSVSTDALHVRIDTEWLQQLPLDLYVPPAAFEVLLDRFEGPLDFLLYLVKKTGFNLLNVDIAPIATQYLQYIEQMKQHDIELASEYMVMAALLADMKSRLLLPKPVTVVDEADPRLNLIARLEAYADIKAGATGLNACEVLERDTFLATVQLPKEIPIISAGEVFYEPDLLWQALQQLLARPVATIHQVQHEAIDLASRLDAIRRVIVNGKPHSFYNLLSHSQGRLGVVVSFMAVLELVRLGEIVVLAHPHDLIIQARTSIVEQYDA